MLYENLQANIEDIRELFDTHALVPNALTNFPLSYYLVMHVEILRAEAGRQNLERKEYRFSPNDKFSFSIGSEKNSDIDLRHSRTVEKNHASLKAYCDGFYLVEHELEPDSHINGARHLLYGMDEVAISSGTSVRVGRSKGIVYFESV